MNKLTQITLAAVVVGASAGALAFSVNMSASQVESEVANRLGHNQAVQKIAFDSIKGGTQSPLVIAAMITQKVPVQDVVCGSIAGGMPTDTVLSSSIASGANAVDVYKAAISCGVSPEYATQTLVLAGADPTLFTEATAAGPGTVNQGNAGSPAIPAGPFVGTSPISTFAGGGNRGGAASRS